ALEGSPWSAVPMVGSWLAYRARRDVVRERVSQAVAIADAPTDVTDTVMDVLDERARGAAVGGGLSVLFVLHSTLCGPALSAAVLAFATSATMRPQLGQAGIATSFAFAIAT